MPVNIGTTFGKADYNVVTALQRLAEAVNGMEQDIKALRETAPDARVRRLEADIQRLTARVDVLAKQLSDLS